MALAHDIVDGTSTRPHPNIPTKSLIRSQSTVVYTAYLGNVEVLPFKVIQEVRRGYEFARSQWW
jgi:hypothetical protein